MPENSPRRPVQRPAQGQPSEKSALDSTILSVANAKTFLLDSYNKLINLEQTNFALGLKHLQQGSYNDAILRFKIVLWLNKSNDIAQYLLGKAYVYAGKHKKAIEPLKNALKTKPELEEAQFLLACCGKGDAPERVPPSLHIEHLEKIAESFEGSNALLCEVAMSLLNENIGNKIGFDILDLDIRTGISGERIFPIANHIVGVEPCLQMLAQARQKRSNEHLIYNELITKMPLDQLKKEERSFDIVQAHFSGSCYGDLNEFFELVQKKLRNDGLFLTSVAEKTGEGFAFNPKRMLFNHSAAYVKKTAKKHRFEFVSSQEIVNENRMTDLVLLFQKNNEIRLDS